MFRTPSENLFSLLYASVRNENIPTDTSEMT